MVMGQELTMLTAHQDMVAEAEEAAVLITIMAVLIPGQEASKAILLTEATTSHSLTVEGHQATVAAVVVATAAEQDHQAVAEAEVINNLKI